MISQLPYWNINNNRIFLRADLNIPLKNKSVASDFRLKAILPTIDYLLKKKSTIVLATHLGRPSSFDPDLSTQILVPWFKKHNYTVTFAENVIQAYEKSFNAKSSIVLLENLRFFSGEKNDDIDFARQLAQLADYYVNDAFGALHRTDTSITLLPQQFLPSKRTIGFLIEKELKILNTLLNNPKHPFLIILGGSKIKDKIPLIKNILTIADDILLCPAIVFSFAKALRKPVGKSLVDETIIPQCLQIIALAKQEKKELLFPIDYQVARNNIDGPLSNASSDTITPDDVGISIGPKTAAIFAKKIQNAKTIFFNGAIGFLERPKTLIGMQSIFKAMAKSNGTSVIAGGDSIAAVEFFDMTHNINHLLAGGGAAIAYLSGDKLPGIIALED